MHFSKGSMSQEQQQMSGCTNGMMYMMPLMSVYIAFIVPAAVGVYWICSNLTGLLQTYILNKMYNPAKIRAQAEIEYQERRARRAAQKAEEKKRLADSRRREEERAAADEAAPAPDPKKGKKKAEKALPVEMPEEIRAEQADDTNNPSANTDETEK